MGTLNDVAEYLASDLAGFISGQHLLLSGGGPAPHGGPCSTASARRDEKHRSGGRGVPVDGRKGHADDADELAELAVGPRVRVRVG